MFRLCPAEQTSTGDAGGGRTAREQVSIRIGGLSFIASDTTQNVFVGSVHLIRGTRMLALKWRDYRNWVNPC